MVCSNCGAPPKIGDVACSYCDAAYIEHEHEHARAPCATITFNLVPGAAVGSDGEGVRRWLADAICRDVRRLERRRLERSAYRVTMG